MKQHVLILWRWALALAALIGGCGQQAAKKTTTPASLAATLASNPTGSTKELESLTKLYSGVQKAVGSEHVLLTAMAYMGRRNVGKTKEDLQGGVAGVISVPLVGVGGNHGLDWYPVLSTHDSAAAFERFQEKLTEYSDLMASDLVTKPEQSFDVLLDAAKLYARELKDADPRKWIPVQHLSQCLEEVSKVAKGLKADTAIVALANTTLQKTVQTVDGGKVVVSCQTLVDAVQASIVDVTKKGKSAQELAVVVKTYLDGVRAKNADDKGPRRHNFLLGPAIGIPVTTSPTKLFLAGGLLEFGFQNYLRLAASVGLQVAYEDPLRHPAWFAGLALSGELGDDLVHLLNGGLTGARKVAATPLGP